MATRKWSASVKTVSTYPEHNLFNQDAETVAKHLASKKVSPKGPASGMRMLNFYINRAGKNLPRERHDELEKAKGILSEIIRKQKEKSSPKSTAKKSAGKSAQTKARKQAAA
jgi:tRNA(adenine34) deaminase